MILLTGMDGSPVTIDRSNIREVHALGSGALILLNVGKPIRVMQSADRVDARLRPKWR